jgi:hypothetical protein
LSHRSGSGRREERDCHPQLAEAERDERERGDHALQFAGRDGAAAAPAPQWSVRGSLVKVGSACSMISA